MTLLDLPKDTEQAILLAFATSVFFFVLNKTFIFCLPSVLRAIQIAQPERLQSYEFVWKFSNILISLIHSAVSGLLCLYSVLSYSALHHDIIDGFASLPYFAVAFTVGYFFYDLYDIFIHRHFYNQYIEIVLHHAFIIMNFGLCVLEHRYVGSMVIGLLSEVHNIFLHNRTLYRMAGFSRDASVYQMIIHSNMCTMFLFRTLPYAFILCKFSNVSLTGQPHVSYPVSALFWTSIGLLFTYNLMLFQRVLNSDYYQRTTPRKQMPSTSSSSTSISNKANFENKVKSH